MSERDQSYMSVVRRDRADVFERLRARVAECGLVDVIWDRRFQERRKGLPRRRHDRRESERRGPTPTTWDSSGYVLVALTEALDPAVMRS